MTLFQRYIGIDYSGARTPEDPLPGIRIYEATKSSPPREIKASKSHWSRRQVYEWLLEQLSQNQPTIIGIDHGFSFPEIYFDRHGIPKKWDVFLEDFVKHWPTDQSDTTVEDIRQGRKRGNMEGVDTKGERPQSLQRQGDSRWRRRTEIKTPKAKSVFHFDVPGSVAKSTHSGLPWIYRLRQVFQDTLHFWPFDGWEPTPGKHLLFEAYPALYHGSFPQSLILNPENQTQDQKDALAICRWLQHQDQTKNLKGHLTPDLSEEESTTASFEGWILGVS